MPLVEFYTLLGGANLEGLRRKETAGQLRASQSLSGSLYVRSRRECLMLYQALALHAQVVPNVFGYLLGGTDASCL
jgi:hypothetical protein